MGEKRNAHRILVGKPVAKRNNMALRESGRTGMDWIHLAEDRGQWSALVNTVMNVRVP
jgi:hypothetical protein